MKMYQIFFGVLMMGIFACSNQSGRQEGQLGQVEEVEEIAEEEAEMEMSADSELMPEDKTPYQREVEKFGNAADFPKFIAYERTNEVVNRDPPIFERILKDYGDYFLTEFVQKAVREDQNENVYFITFNKTGKQIDLEQVKSLSNNSRAWDEFITDRDIRVKTAFRPILDDGSLSGDTFINYQHLSIEDDGSISRIFCQVVDGKYLSVLESYAVTPDELITVQEEGTTIEKQITKLDLSNGYLEANNGRVKMAVFSKSNGYNISLLQRSEFDMCCDYYEMHAVKFWENELCEFEDITAKVIPKIDTSAFFQSPSTYDSLKDLLSLNYQIPQFGTSLKIIPEFCSCGLEDRGISEPPAMNTLTLKWNKEAGVFEW